ncbi:membrane dipeptidase [Pontibacter sp. KCTC 32443]|uniref:dipeptidase n=1 Tax=Pontibacter TaxID=323449 RepID=UPI00164CFDFB|nr:MULTISPECIES: membrane dipeptidase [Pontibacter]MBC5774249.1 membrane dipeptidase [Pontibacter sp. KCTC 32443]
MTAATLPIIDLHCDLLVYLTDVPGAIQDNVDEIGCALPSLTQGNVKLQVMAIYCPTKSGSTAYAKKQSEAYKLLAESENCLTAVTNLDELHQALKADQTGMVVAIENASGFCEEDEPLEDGFKKLEKIIEDAGTPLYISMTHSLANRFGGGNATTLGITRDGKMLLDYMHGRKIAIDMSHTSDALAYDILEHIDREKLDIPVIASHSNFRPLWEHERNLPYELMQEIIRRKGLIGINFLRSFLHNDEPDAILDHIKYGFAHGAEDVICFGADYFYTADEKDVSRLPFYFPDLLHAGISYSYILKKLQEQLRPEQLQKLAYQNALRFIERLWSVS